MRWCKDHIEYDADPRQVERLVAECGLEGANSMVTPSVKVTFSEHEVDEALPPHLHTAFRGAAARANYLAADRIDIQYSCKEVCRWMAKPTLQAWGALKRSCRFLNGLPRLVYTYPKQEIECIDVYTDTDLGRMPIHQKEYTWRLRPAWQARVETLVFDSSKCHIKFG